MSYICPKCFQTWPCSDNTHNWMDSLKVWMRDEAEVSIPCYMFDHAECRVAMFCACQCHKQSDLEESSSSAPLTNP